MKRRDMLLIASAALAAGCSTPSDTAADPAAKRREIDVAVDGALGDLYAKAAGSRELTDKAQGILVFPSVLQAGFVVGGSYGAGALRKKGTTVGYYSIGAASVGLLAGAQTKAMYFLFMTQDALAKFEASQGWTAGADASIAIADIGAGARVDTKTAQAPVIGYVRGNSGFIADLSVDGTKITKLKL